MIQFEKAIEEAITFAIVGLTSAPVTWAIHVIRRQRRDLNKAWGRIRRLERELGISSPDDEKEHR